MFYFSNMVWVWHSRAYNRRESFVCLDVNVAVFPGEGSVVHGIGRGFLVFGECSLDGANLDVKERSV